MGVALPKTAEAAFGFRAFVQNFYSEALVGAGWDGRPFPRLASEWQLAEDRLTLTLTLRPNLKFHDGTSLDNRFTKKILESALKSSMLVSYESVKNIEAVGTDQVALKLSRPEALLLADLANSNIAMPGKPDVGVGPYRLLERGTTTRLAAFDDYFRGKPKIDAIEIREYEEQRASWAALLRGQIDAVHEIVPNAVDFIREQRSVTHSLSRARISFTCSST
jgi:peptide/nickel transport system substrate-binding protein